jgi:hypothetical protein
MAWGFFLDVFVPSILRLTFVINSVNFKDLPTAGGKVTKATEKAGKKK